MWFCRDEIGRINYDWRMALICNGVEHDQVIKEVVWIKVQTILKRPPRPRVGQIWIAPHEMRGVRWKGVRILAGFNHSSIRIFIHLYKLQHHTNNWTHFGVLCYSIIITTDCIRGYSRLTTSWLRVAKVSIYNMKNIYRQRHKNAKKYD